MKNKHKGFTLVELLVVIVIIGILATISIGTFQGYFVKARNIERQATVTNVVNAIKSGRATKEQNQYDFADEIELGNFLESTGMKIPTRPDNDCYIYASTNNGTEFIFFTGKEGEELDKPPILGGTPAFVSQLSTDTNYEDLWDYIGSPYNPYSSETINEAFELRLDSAYDNGTDDAFCYEIFDDNLGLTIVLE